MSDNPINSPSQHLDFNNLPDLPNFETGSYNLHQYDEDFFSTDVPMPSSPPRMSYGFNNTSAGGALDWDTFGFDSGPANNEKENGNGNGKRKENDVQVHVKEEPMEETTMNETV